MPEVHEGDLLAIMSAGAYGFVMASNYNSRPLPAEVLIRGRNSRSFAGGRRMTDRIQFDGNANRLELDATDAICIPILSINSIALPNSMKHLLILVFLAIASSALRPVQGEYIFRGGRTIAATMGKI